MLEACHRPSLLMTWQYAMALAGTEGAKADFGLIRFQGKPVGIAAVEKRTALKLFTAARLYRGPAWIYEEIPGEMLKLVLGMLKDRYRLSRGVRFVLHPELEDNEVHRRKVGEAGYTRRMEGYRTAWLDLAPDTADLRAGLGQKWRNALNQAERNDLVIETGIRHLPWLIDVYQEHRSAHGYTGPAPALLRLMAKVDGESGDGRPLFSLYRACRKGQPLAGILLARHGKAATYLVAWNGREGRRRRANHLLLWRAMCDLRAEECRWLDLGGLPADPESGGMHPLSRFKLGTGARPSTLVGGYL